MGRHLVWLAALSLVAFVGCGDDDGGGGTDAGGMADAGGGGTDAGPGEDAGGGGMDAGPAEDAGGGGTDAGPAEDAGGGGAAHCAGDDIFIAAVDPDTGITVFNPTDTDFEVTAHATYTFCSRPSYPTLASLGATATIPANGSHTFDWPVAFSDTDAGGELALYTDASFTSASSMLDFVCWGTGHGAGSSRKSVAEGGGLWSGDCVGAITGGSLKRIADTDGTSAASYDPTGATADLTCP